MSFEGKAVLVTGGSSGIGASIAIQFAKEGATVAIVGRNEEKLINVSEQCKEVGKAPLILIADITSDVKVKFVISKTIEVFKRLDILVNNAGIFKFNSLHPDEAMPLYDELMSINTRSMVYLTMLAMPHLIETKGNVVNISSISGHKVFLSNGLFYGMTKAAVNHFTQGMAAAFAPDGVRVNCVSPGPVRSDIFINNDIPLTFEVMKQATALDKVGEPEEIADLVLFLASDRAISITGSIFVADNGCLLK